MNKKDIIKILISAVITTLFTVSVVYGIARSNRSRRIPPTATQQQSTSYYADPTKNPPEGNVSVPLNATKFGQIKQGGLIVYSPVTLENGDVIIENGSIDLNGAILSVATGTMLNSAVGSNPECSVGGIPIVKKWTARCRYGTTGYSSCMTSYTGTQLPPVWSVSAPTCTTYISSIDSGTSCTRDRWVEAICLGN